MVKDTLIAVNWCLDLEGKVIVDSDNMIQLFKANITDIKSLKNIIKDYKRPSCSLQEDTESKTISLIVADLELYKKLQTKFEIVFLKR